MVQKPSVRPGRPCRERPTLAPHSWFPQNRLRSGTSGFRNTAESGSGRGTLGIVTSPAPSRSRVVFGLRVPRVITIGPAAAPVSLRASRPETERRDDRDLEERLEREPDAPSLSRASLGPGIRVLVLLSPMLPSADTTGANPQPSQ
ncbi:hypothetical protein GCM10022227_25210 [Streptomyces sedi]